jgi:hypothetical protein
MDSSYIDMDKWMNAGSDAGSEQTDWLPTMSLGLVVLIILIVLFIIYGIPYIRKLIALSRTQTLYNSLKKTVDTVLTQEQNSVTQRQSALFGTAAAQLPPRGRIPTLSTILDVTIYAQTAANKTPVKRYATP